jgi:hypothetical protein
VCVCGGQLRGGQGRAAETDLRGSRPAARGALLRARRRRLALLGEPVDFKDPFQTPVDCKDPFSDPCLIAPCLKGPFPNRC